MWRNKKQLLILCSVIVMIFTSNIGICKTINWKVGYGGAPNDPTYKMVEAFVEEVEKISEGQFKIKLVLTTPLGYSVVNTLKYLKSGLGEAAVVVPHYLAGSERMMGVLLPQGVLFDVEDNRHLVDVLFESSTPIYDKWGVSLEVPAFSGATVDWVLISNKPINTLEQLKGKKIRHSDKIAIRAFNKIGVAAQPVPLTETYLALKTGVVDGAAYGRLFTLQQSLQEVTKYISYMGPYTAAMAAGIGVNKKAWAKLPDDMKKVFKEAGKTVLWDIQFEKWETRAYEKYSLAELEKKGMEELEPFPRADRIKMQRAALEAWKEECEKLGPEAISHYNKMIQLITIPEE